MSAEPRDPHLLAALRHAPDRDAAPPPELTARIFAAAREAVQPSAPSLLQRAAAWFASPRLGAAFATLAVAVLLGVMWSSQEPPVPASVSPEVAQENKRQTVTADAQREAPPAPAVAQAPMADPVPPAPPGVRTAPSERRAAKPEADRPAPERARGAAKALNEAAAEVAPPVPPTETTKPKPAQLSAAPAAAPAAPAPVATPAAPAVAIESRADAAVPTPPAAPDRAVAPATTARARTEPPPIATGALSQPQQPALLAGSAAAFDPLHALDADGSAGWTWTALGVGERAHGDAQHALWRQMRAATAGRWSPAPSMRPLVPWLLLRAAGGRGAVLWFMNDALYLSEVDGRTWRAAVTPEQVSDWQQAVARW